MPGRVHRAAATSSRTAPARRPTGSPSACSAPTRPRTTSSSEQHPALAEIGQHLGAAIGSLVNVFGPEVVVVGGGFGVAAFDLLLEPAREVDARARRSPPAGEVPIVRARARPRRGHDRRRRSPPATRSSRRRVPLAVCATPIGNLDDVTLRVLAELREADVVLAEDTRHTRGLLDRHGIEARLLSLPRAQRGRARRGAAAAARGRRADRARLGCGDAGHLRSRRAARAGGARRRACAVTVLPGPSAVETALVASGLVGGAVRVRRASCRGARPSARRCGRSSRRGRGRWSRSSRRSGSAASLRSLAAAAPEREVAVCRELTKRFEEVVRGPAAELAARFAEAAEGRDHARARAGRRGAVVASAAEALRRGGRARRGRNAAAGRRRGRLAPHRTCPETTSTADLCDNSVTTALDSIDNRRRPSTVANRRSPAPDRTRLDSRRGEPRRSPTASLDDTDAVVLMRRSCSLSSSRSRSAPAGAWTWPADGPVLQPFSFDPEHPKAPGQHRGIDVAGSLGDGGPRAGGGSRLVRRHGARRTASASRSRRRTAGRSRSPTWARSP